MPCRVVHDSMKSAEASAEHSQQASSKPSRSSKRSGSAASANSFAWLILEFCDKGCLQVRTLSSTFCSTEE